MRTVSQETSSSIVFAPLALGTWTFAGDAIWSETDEKESIRVIHRALEQGINLFDSSPNYGSGRSEEILGKGLFKKKSSNPQVATKMKIDGKSEKDIADSVDQSLRRLKIEQIDLMQIHWPGTPDENRRALDCFMDLREKGKIREIGVCNFGTYDLEETEVYPVISNQLPYNLLWRVVEDSIAPLTKKQGKKIWTYSTFQQGLLSGKYTSLEEFPKGRMRTRHFSPLREAANHGGPGMEEETESTLKAFIELSGRYKISPLSLAMNFSSSRSFIDTLLVGARTVEQLDEIISESRNKPDEEILKDLEGISESLKNKAAGNPDMFQEKSRVRY